MSRQYINVQRAHKEKMLAITLGIIGVLFLAYLSAQVTAYMERNEITDSGYLVYLFNIWGEILQHPRPWSHHVTLPILGTGDVCYREPFFNIFCLYGLITTAAVYIAWSNYVTNRHYKNTEVAGTGKFQDAQSIKLYNMRYTEPRGKGYAKGPMNSIYGKHTFLGMENGKYNMNNNAMIIGAPGTGKSFGIVRPNIMQMNSSYVITDPSAELLKTCGKMLENNEYEIKVFDLTDMQHSHRYNPFNYIRTEQDVLTLIDCYINSTTEPGRSGGDKFWLDAEKGLLCAIIFYLREYETEDKQNFAEIAKMVRQAKSDDSETQQKNAKAKKTELDKLFDDIRDYVDPDDICLKYYDVFKLAPDKTTSGILISTGVRLGAFNMETVANLTCADDLDLMTLGDKKTAVFIIVPSGENAYAFLVNMLYSQMFDTLYYHGSHDFGDGRLPNDVRFILDEFANIGVIPSFQQKLTTMRKYGLSCMIFIQSLGQIKNLYKDDYTTLIDACTTFVYLGGADTATMEDIQKKLGTQTIKQRKQSSSHNAAGGGSDSVSTDYTQRWLLTLDEIRRLPSNMLLVIISGQQPFYDEKYNPYTMHENRDQIGNLRTGDNIYYFDYCNSTVDESEKLAEKRRKFEAHKESKLAGKAGQDAFNGMDNVETEDQEGVVGTRETHNIRGTGNDSDT